MQRSLQWARGTLLNVRDADQLLGDLAEYMPEVQSLHQHGHQGKILETFCLCLVVSL